MRKKTELVYAINALFAVCNPRDIAPDKIPQHLDTVHALENMDFDDLQQALRFNAETVFAYSAEGCDFDSGCNYYGQELFPRRATRIYSYCVMEEKDVVLLNRVLELWLLDDFSFALVASIETDYEEGEYTTSYRVLRATDLDEIAQEMPLDYDDIAANLIELAESYNEIGVPTYEL